MNLDIDITDRHAAALSQVLKRLGFTDARKLSIDDDEAYDALYAMEQIRKALAERGRESKTTLQPQA